MSIFLLAFHCLFWLNVLAGKGGIAMKEHEIHISANYMTSGGTEEGYYFVEYVTAEDAAEAEQIKSAELEAAGYYNIEMDTIEA